jgi:hypothetical protein
LEEHSSRLTLSHPWPLQAFCPAQAFFAVAQKLCPLQLLIPEHRTCTAPTRWSVFATTPAVMNKSATAVAIERDVVRIVGRGSLMDLHYSDADAGSQWRFSL